MKRVIALGLLLAGCTEPEGTPLTTPEIVPPAPTPPVEVAEAGRIRVEVSFEGVARRRMEVVASYPTDGRPELVLAMPTWIPGSYLLREFARHVVDPSFSKPGGERLFAEKVRKNRFRVVTEGAERVEMRYVLLAHELTVRTNFVDPDYAVVNPAATVFMDVDHPERGFELVFHPDEGWSRVDGGLPELEGVAAGFYAESFDALVDSPFLLGHSRVDSFEVKGVEHRVVHVGDRRRFPLERAAQDLAAIVEYQAGFWGGLPYPNYAFLNVLDRAGGGLEHRTSTLMMFPPDRALEPAGYRRWLSLASHELFHAWNGKRLRPVVLGPFDLEREAYTRSLWMVEGMTSYYDDLVLRRAGLHTDASYLEALSGNLRALEQDNGETHQSLARSSYDTWIEFYRPDEESANTAVNYYTKGSLVGWVLDAEIRRMSRGRRSLDDVMREAYAAYAGAKGYPDDALYGVFETVAGPEARRLAERLTQSAEPLDIGPALEAFGLRRVEAGLPSADTPEGWAKRALRTDLGATLTHEHGQWVVSRVHEGGPGAEAGLNPQDEILFLDQDRIPDEGLAPLLKRHIPGETVELLVSRRGRAKSLVVKLGTSPTAPAIEIDPGASSAAKRRRKAWLSGR